MTTTHRWRNRIIGHAEVDPCTIEPHSDNPRTHPDGQLDEEIDVRQWLRRTLDLISAIVLLRATIFTRVTGDAAIRGQRASVVPIGRIGTDEPLLSLSQAVARFTQESSIFLLNSLPSSPRGLVKAASDAVLELFRNSRWTGRLPHRQRGSISAPLRCSGRSHLAFAPK
jgi:hypothetical protein